MHFADTVFKKKKKKTEDMWQPCNMQIYQHHFFQ